MFLHAPDKVLMNYALGLRRHDVRILVDLLTGHSTLSNHLHVHYAQSVEKWRKPPSFPRTKVLFHYDHETRHYGGLHVTA